jgi:hypothetical protein
VTPDLPHEIAIHLTGGPVESIEPLRGGGNNRLFRVVRGGTPVALKLYAGDADQRRERFEREFGGLTFLWRRGERRIAEPLAADPDARAALYGWLAGTAAPTAGADEVAAMAAFARSLHVAAGDPAARSLPDAREAVLSSRALQAQLLARIARLRAVESEHPELSALLTDIERATVALPDDPAPLPRAVQTLSPSDFGTHNALRTAGGLAFIDFEYFGWDDPVKLVADVVWHPGMNLTPALRQKFFMSAVDTYEVDHEFTARFERHAAVYGLRWALIVLNEFLPEVWQRRVAAGMPDDARAVRARQCAKAVALVDRARRGAVLA